MFRPFRLLMLAVLAATVYAGFFWLPPPEAPDGVFDAKIVAAHEIAAWQAVRTHRDFEVYFAIVQMLREQNRCTWFRAIQSGFYLTRAMTTFSGLHTRYERVLPDLEAAAGVEKAWRKTSVDPVAVARAQLNWWVIRRMPNLNAVDQIGVLIAEEYALRYPLAGGRTVEAAHLRAQAVKMLDQDAVEPDWKIMSDLLVQSHRLLGVALTQTPAVPVRGR